MTGNEKRAPDGNGRAVWAELRRTGGRLYMLLCDCLWDFTPTSLALWWLRKRVARLKREQHSLRRAVRIHRSAADRRPADGTRLIARLEAIEAALTAVDRRLEDLERRTLDGAPERRLIPGLIAFLLLGLANSYLGWLADVRAVQDAFSVAVSGGPR